MRTLRIKPIEYRYVKPGNRIQFQYSPSDLAKWVFEHFPHSAAVLFLDGIDHSSVSGYVTNIDEEEIYLRLSDPNRKSSLIKDKKVCFQRKRMGNIELLEEITLSNSKFFGLNH